MKFEEKMNIIEQLSLNIIAISIAMVVIILLLMYWEKNKKISETETITKQKINIESYTEAPPSFQQTAAVTYPIHADLLISGAVEYP